MPVMDQEGSAEILPHAVSEQPFPCPARRRGRVVPLSPRLCTAAPGGAEERREPGLAPTLHRRAYSWHRDHGTTDEAIQHAVAAEGLHRSSRADRNLLDQVRQHVAVRHRPGLVATTPRRSTDERGASALDTGVGALTVGKTGGGGAGHRSDRTAGRTRCGTAARRLQLRGGEPDDATGRLPLGRCRRPAGACPTSGRAQGPGSPWRPLACWAVGMGLYFGGERDEADRGSRKRRRRLPRAPSGLLARRRRPIDR